MTEPLVKVENLTKSFGHAPAPALDALSTTIEPGQVTGLVGPDGAGKTTLLRLLAGLMLPDEGKLSVCGFDPGSEASRLRRFLAYMPQRFGLYEDLSVIENLELYADLRGVVGSQRRRVFERLLTFTGLGPFTSRLAGALSGGMKQKLGLACALVQTPKLLLLDEPSVGVDPISRRELWHMVHQLVDEGIGVIWSTAYLDEAELCASVLLLSEGKLLYQGRPHDLTETMNGRTFLVRNFETDRRVVLTRALEHPGVIDGVVQGSSVRLVVGKANAPLEAAEIGVESAEIVPTSPRFEDAFIDLLGGGPKGGSPFAAQGSKRSGNADDIVVEARNLTRRFGDFTAVDTVSFSVKRGEIFGLIGSNGAGKSTTFKMLCGLLKPTSGSASVAGVDLIRSAGKARARLGYMAQKFSLYGDLSVAQNLAFFAGVYGLAGRQRREAIATVVETFALQPYLGANAIALPLGFKQRLALACAVMHKPDVLFLDEPTSGVDPRTRREFWTHVNAMVSTGVTVLVTTHFLDEAEYCDRMALVFSANVIAEGTPDALKQQVRTSDLPEPTLEDAFIALVESSGKKAAA